MIFARDKSQMCNNLLQFAHVYAWAREHGRSVMSMRFSYKYPYFKIRHTEHVSFPLYLLAKYAAALRLLPTANYKHIERDLDREERKMLRHKHVVVSGWYARWDDLFLKYRSEICDLFTIDSQYTDPVRQKMKECERDSDAETVTRLGVHIRRGDYKDWCGGIYCYDDKTYAQYINAFARMKHDRTVHVYLSTNDPEVSVERFAAQMTERNVVLHLLAGNAVEDLFMLSECDYIMGPPSTYSLVAAMYRDIPLCRMDQTNAETMSLEDFKLFDYWFRRIV